MPRIEEDFGPSPNQEFLDDVFERAVRLLEEGGQPTVEELLDGHTDLLAQVENLIRLAQRVAFAPKQALPTFPGYTLLEELGHGGMGAVYLARQESLGGRPVALKVLPASMGLSQRARERFVNEARAIGRLRHPNIVAVHDVVQEGGVCAYAMELIDGSSLAVWIGERSDEVVRHAGSATRRDDDGPRRPSDAASHIPFVCRTGMAIARALAAVHAAGLLHRDIKPSNILLRRDPGAPGPLLADFGLVRETDSSLHTQDGQFAGTVAYAPPEQLRGEMASIDARSDIYALGVTLYHALALRLPFEQREPAAMLRKIETGQAAALRKLNPRVPRDLETIVAKAMDPDPAGRYQTADALADDLERLLSFQPIRARRAGPFIRMAKLVRRNRAAALGLAVGSVLSLSLALLAMTYFFFAPQWTQSHVTQARLALLDPAQANGLIWIFWKIDAPERQQIQPASVTAMTNALEHYDAALRWSRLDDELLAERRVVAEALRRLAPPPPTRTARNVERPAGSQESESPSDLRSKGLLAFLTGDSAQARVAWLKYESSRDFLKQPDEFVAGAMGLLYLEEGHAARAYPRLREAVRAFPNVGFLTMYLADAAVQCGDLGEARRLLDQARALPRNDPLNGLTRVEADLAAAEGRHGDAERLYRQAMVNNYIAKFRLAQLLESTGRLEEAIAQYREVCDAMPYAAKPREALSAALKAAQEGPETHKRGD